MNKAAAIERVIVCCATAACLGVALVEAQTARPFSLQLLLIPAVLVAGWTAGVTWALMAALGPTVVRLAAEVAVRRGALDPPFVWDVFTQFAVLATVAVLAALLRQERRRSEIIGQTDALTGLLNGPGFQDRLSAEINRSSRIDSPMTVVFIDCDEFKAINDRLGHLRGDEVLRRIAATLRSTTRNYDVLARLGGDEFAVLLPQTPAAAARNVVGRLQANLSAAMSLGGWPVRFSMGAATHPAPAGTAEDFLRAADEAMYVAKRSGKGASHFVQIGPPAAPADESTPATEAEQLTGACSC